MAPHVALSFTVDGGDGVAQDFGSKIMGLWPGFTESETDFSYGIHFSIKDYTYAILPL